MSKARLNLLIERSVIERGKRYSKAHGTSLSRLVGDFLAHLPGEEEAAEDLTPTVKRLLGAAKGVEHEEYRRYLLEKYSE